MSAHNPCNYKPWYLGCTTLCRDISDTETSLPLKDQFCIELCALLGTECYTYLVIDNGFKTETVRVSCSAGNPVMERSIDGRPRSWYAGDNVTFRMTPESMKDCVACGVQETEEEETPLIKSDTLEITMVDGQWCIENTGTTADGECSWSDCGYKYSWDGSRVTKEALPATDVLRDGVYANATIVVEGGCIKTITKGCPLVVSGCPDDCACPTEDGV